MQSFTSQSLGVVGILGENLDLFSLLGFYLQTNSDHKAPKIKLCSVRALKGYLNEKNLMHGRVMAAISKFVDRFLERTLIALFLTKLQWSRSKMLQVGLYFNQYYPTALWFA